MNSLEILYALSHLPDHIVGVYASDKIPETWSKPAAFVFNTDDSKNPGSHWVAAYVDSDSRGFYFDSYGLPPFIPDHVTRLRKNCKTLRHNGRQLQSASSTVCGQFCIMFLFFMASGIGFDNFTNFFGRDTKKNDILVEEFVNSAIKRKINLEYDVLTGNGSQRACSAQICRARQ